jgi:hypothetical protein
MRKGAGEEHEHPEIQEDKEASDSLIIRCSVADEADRVVPAEIDEDGHEGVPSCFDDDIGQDVCWELLERTLRWE